MNRIVGARGTVVATLLAIVFVGMLGTASMVVLTAEDKTPQQCRSGIAVVGDQYTAGIQNRLVWPTLMAQRTGWSVFNFALPDGGYVAEGRGGHGFTYQVDRAQGANPQAVVIVGGIADSRFPYTRAITVGAREAINKIKLGGEQALIVGPTWFETPVPYSVRRVSDAVREVAEEAGVPFLDALAPPWLTKAQMRPDLNGPNDEGQSVIADKVAAWLRSEVAI
jgi:lysophospholipase L1-like esterase